MIKQYEYHMHSDDVPNIAVVSNLQILLVTLTNFTPPLTNKTKAHKPLHVSKQLVHAVFFS